MLRDAFGGFFYGRFVGQGGVVAKCFGKKVIEAFYIIRLLLDWQTRDVEQREVENPFDHASRAKVDELVFSPIGQDVLNSGQMLVELGFGGVCAVEAVGN